MVESFRSSEKAGFDWPEISVLRKWKQVKPLHVFVDAVIPI